MSTGEGQRWAILGMGRAGLALGSGLDRAGLLAATWTRSSGRSSTVARALSARVSHHTGPPVIPAEVDVVLVAVPDQVLRSTVGSLAPEARRASGRVWLHVSGVLDASVWGGLDVAGPAGSCHPLVSMQGDGLDAERLEGAFFAIDGAEAAREAAGVLAEAVGARVGVIEGAAQRTAYHLAAVLASNGVYALLAAAGRVLERGGLAGEPALRHALAILASGSATSAAVRGPVEAATGPVVRGDADTVDRHLNWLDDNEPSLKPLYRALCEELLEVAESRGERDHLLAALRHVLHR